VCLRPPVEVALSLKRRQNIPMAVGFRFWDRHARGLLDHATPNTVYVDFNELAGPEPLPELNRMARFFDLAFGDEELIARFEAVFQRTLKNFDNESLTPPARTQHLWAALRERHQSQ